MNKVRIIIFLVALLVIGISLTVGSISNIIKLNGTIPDFNYDSMQNIKNGDFVQGYVGYILDCYASETTTNTTMGIETSSRTSEEYFIMPLVNEEDMDKDLYITVTASKAADRDLLYKICDETYKSYMGNTDVEWTEFGIVARVKEIDSDLTPYLIEWFQETEWFDEDENHKTSEAEIRQHILPYELVVYNTSGAYTGLIIGLVIIAAFAVAGVIAWKKLRPAPLNEQTSFSSYTPGGMNGTGVSGTPNSAQSANSGGFAEAYKPAEARPITDIPQPLQPDEFFARPAKAPKPAEEKTEAPKPQPEIPKPTDPKPASEPTPVIPAAAGDMDALDTSALNIDDLEYYDTSEAENSEAEYEFTNDVDFGESNADDIEISE